VNSLFYFQGPFVCLYALHEVKTFYQIPLHFMLLLVKTNTTPLFDVSWIYFFICSGSMYCWS